MYISCPRWRRKSAGDLKWGIIPQNSLIEGLAYKLFGGRLPNARSRSLSYPPCSDNSLDCALKSFKRWYYLYQKVGSFRCYRPRVCSLRKVSLGTT